MLQGIDVKLNTGLLTIETEIQWKRRKQSMAALPLIESEWEAMLEGLKEIVSSARIMEETGMSEKIKKIEMRQLNCGYIGEWRKL